MKIIKRIMPIVFIFCMLFAFTPSVTVRADTTDKKYGPDTKEYKAAIKLLGLTSKKKLKEMQAGWDAAIQAGATEAAVAGWYGNFKRESSWNPAAVEDSGPGIGLAQWTTNGERQAIQKWSKKCAGKEGHPHKTLNGYNICTNFACQLAFCYENLKNEKKTGFAWISDWMKEYKGWCAYFKKQNKNGAWNKKTGEGSHKIDPQHIFDGGYDDIRVIKSGKEYLKETDPKVTAINYAHCHERGFFTWALYGTAMRKQKKAGNVSHCAPTCKWVNADYDYFRDCTWSGNYSIKYITVGAACTYWSVQTAKVAEACAIVFGSGNIVSGVDKSNIDKEKEQDAANTFYINGLMDESKYVSLSKMIEKVPELASKDDFSDEDRASVVLWQQDTESNWQTTVINITRTSVVFIAIVLTVWIILLYLAFWFDTVNTILDVEVLPIISFGRLRRAEIGEDVTWHKKDDNGNGNNKGKKEKTGPKLIDHKRLLILVVLAIALVVLILSGTLYNWVTALTLKIVSFFG